MAGQAGFFDLDERYAGLSASGDPLERLSRVVDFEIFREDLERALKRSERRRGGRPPMDAVMMFKVLVLQALWGLSDEQLEYQVRDRLSFMRFLGLDLSGRVPDYSTVWRFREALVQAGAMEGLFALRRGTEGARLLRSGRPDRGCVHRRSSEAASDRRGEGGDQARRAAGLEAGEGHSSADRGDAVGHSGLRRSHPRDGRYHRGSTRYPRRSPPVCRSRAPPPARSPATSIRSPPRRTQSLERSPR